jgi:hypothetical protein
MDADPHSDVPDDRLARLLAVGTGGESGWRPEEMGAVFAHQWSATVEFELGGLRPPAAQRLASLSAAQGLLVRSFGDLFRHPCPPLELLVLTKDYAKRLLDSDDSPLPREIALALYYTSILVARDRLGQRISALDEAGLAKGVDWLVVQDWVDAETKELLRAGLERTGIARPRGDGPTGPAGEAPSGA